MRTSSMIMRAVGLIAGSALFLLAAVVSAQQQQ